MAKRFTTIGIVICIATIALGFSLFDFQQFLYQQKNGPPLVKDGFIERVRIAIANDGEFSHKYGICSIDENGFSIADSKNDYMVYAEIERDNKFYVSVNRIKRDPFVIYNLDSPRPANKRFNDVSIENLNEMIDENIFKDIQTRAKNKIEILKRIEQLQR